MNKHSIKPGVCNANSVIVVKRTRLLQFANRIAGGFDTSVLGGYELFGVAVDGSNACRVVSARLQHAETLQQEIYGLFLVAYESEVMLRILMTTISLG